VAQGQPRNTQRTNANEDQSRRCGSASGKLLYLKKQMGLVEWDSVGMVWYHNVRLKNKISRQKQIHHHIHAVS
jgi:hypothetical protein